MKNFLIYFTFAILSLGFSNNTIAQTEQNANLQQDHFLKSQKKNVIKFNVLSAIALEHLELSYERAITPRQSIELKVGIIGLGIMKHEKGVINRDTPNEKEFASVSDGMFFAAGYKFFFANLTSSNKKRKPNVLKCWYVQPELIAGFYTRNQALQLPSEFEEIIDKQKINYKAGIINLGVQGIISKNIVFDLSFGVGIGDDNFDSLDNEWLYFGEFHRGLYKLNQGVSIASKGGIKIGFLF